MTKVTNNSGTLVSTIALRAETTGAPTLIMFSSRTSTSRMVSVSLASAVRPQMSTKAKLATGETFSSLWVRTQRPTPFKPSGLRSSYPSTVTTTPSQRSLPTTTSWSVSSTQAAKIALTSSSRTVSRLTLLCSNTPTKLCSWKICLLTQSDTSRCSGLPSTKTTCAESSSTTGT